MSWYTLQTRPNYEAKVMGEIQKRTRDKQLNIREVFSPEEVLIEYKDGKKKERKRRLYTNYLFLEMDYSDEIWHALKDIHGVTGFVGNRSNPVTVPEKDIMEMKAKVSGTNPKPKVTFDIESKVRITSGSFADFYGIVRAVDYEKNKVNVALNIFNRETLVELDINAIEMAK